MLDHRRSNKLKAAMSIRNLMDSRICQEDKMILTDDHDGSIDYADDESGFCSSGETSRAENKKQQQHESPETRIILVLRLVILVVVLVTGAMTAASVYVASQKYAEQTSEIARIEANNLLDTIETRLVHMLQVMNDYSLELSMRGGQDWPFVSFQDFGGAQQRRHAGFETIMLLPLVNASDIPAWNNYTKNHNDWSMKSHITQNKLKKTTVASVHQDASSLPITARNDGPFLPLWQLSPKVLNPSIYIADMLSLSDIADDLRYVLSSGQATLGHVINKSSNDNEFNHLLERIMESTGEMNQDDTEEPFGTVYYPIRSQFNATSVVGILGATFRWSKLISDAAVSRTSHCVLDIDKDSKSFSFSVNDDKAVYFANADARDKQKYISAKTWDFFTSATASYTMSKSQKTQSQISFRVYPATATNNKSSAGICAALVAVMFTLLTMLFLLYDCIVQRRQKQVHEAALRSTKIVSSLFPNQVADRLFQNHADHDACSKDVEQDDMEESQVKAAFLSHQNQNAPGLIKEPPKHKLKQVLKDSGNMYDDLVMNQSDKPIADFFPACTVLFADIAGFTAFASERPPEQVFQLLQAVYQAFDKAARKRHVFKVETIGDCYVAVTGLPDRQPNHAEIMAGFALHCRSKMKEVTRKLERILGPDTSSLVMRFGLHSGPVIAGVLRGERARFQLFGDTVNTAARMESTGQRDRVQVSEATANLLIEAGKGSWVTPREDLVSAKGKGQMQTFWLESREAYSQRTKLMSQISCDSFDGMPEEKCPEAPWQTSATGREAMKTAKHEIWARSEIDMPPPTTLRRSASDATCRLIDWNTQILLNLLKPVVAHRVATKGFAFQPDDSVLSSLISDEGNTLDEVREIIELPRLDTSQPIQHVDPDSIELDGDVEGQLRDFVTGIASMYRDNPFHNYAHACHVQMSMIKLLQRVVSPDSVDYRGAKDSVASDVHNYTFGITSDPLTSFAVVWAALIHDVDHCGVSNGQLVKENAPVATFYKGKSVAEQNSIDLAWELLMQPNFKELRSCIFADQSELNRFRQITVNIVISTDIFDPQLKALRDQRWQKAFSEASLSEPVHVQVNRKATIVLEHLIQASDVSHTMQHWEIYRKWNERLFFEMHLAFKTGRVDGVCPSVGWYKGEIGFFDFYIIPLAKKLKDCGVFGVSSDECLTNALENRRIWVERGEDIVKEMLEMNYLEKMDEGKKTRRSRRKQNKLSISFED